MKLDVRWVLRAALLAVLFAVSVVAIARVRAPFGAALPRVGPARVARALVGAAHNSGGEIARPAPRGFTHVGWLEGLGPHRGTQVAIYVPPGLDLAASAKLHVVVYIHGAGGQGIDFPTNGGGVPRLHDAHAAVVLVAARAWIGATGAFGDRGFLRRFLDRVVARVPGPRPRGFADVASVTLAAHSAGGLEVARVLDRGGLGDRLTNVVLFDPVMPEPAPYVRWLASGSATRPGVRRLVVITGIVRSARQSALAVADFVRRHDPAAVAIDPPGLVTDAIRTHRVVVAQSHDDHGWIPLTYFAKTVAGLGLPRMPPGPDPLAAPPAPDAPGVRPLAPGSRVEGRLERGDTARPDGAVVDDYAVWLAAGAPVTLVTRGGRSLTEYHCDLDVRTAAFFGGRLVAQDDDGAGRFGSRVAFTPRAAGAYVVRVTSAGSGAHYGPYSLAACAGSTDACQDAPARAAPR